MPQPQPKLRPKPQPQPPQPQQQQTVSISTQTDPEPGQLKLILKYCEARRTRNMAQQRVRELEAAMAAAHRELYDLRGLTLQLICRT